MRAKWVQTGDKTFALCKVTKVKQPNDWKRRFTRQHTFILLLNHLLVFSLQISNTSELSINYSLKLDSLSPLRHSRAQILPRFLPPFNDMTETQRHVLGVDWNWIVFHLVSNSRLMILNLFNFFFHQVRRITMAWQCLIAYLLKVWLVQVSHSKLCAINQPQQTDIKKQQLFLFYFKGICPCTAWTSCFGPEKLF